MFRKRTEPAAQWEDRTHTNSLKYATSQSPKYRFIQKHTNNLESIIIPPLQSINSIHPHKLSEQNRNGSSINMNHTHTVRAHTLTLLFLIAKMRDAHPSVSMVHPGMEEERQFLAMFSNGQSENSF